MNDAWVRQNAYLPTALLWLGAAVPLLFFARLANRVPGAARERDQIALYKLAAGVVLFPLTYALVAECDRLAGVFRRPADNRSA